MSLVAALLMALDEKQYPPFRIRVFEAAYGATQYTQPKKNSDEADIYEHALGFLDRFIDESAQRDLELRHRLDAQSVVWAIREGRGDDDDEYPIEENDEPINVQTHEIDLVSLADSVFLPVRFLREIEILLKEKQQVIFQGPPGTGKTFVAQKLAACLAGDKNRVTLVQFHPSYAYEDFIEGYRPTLKDGQASFELREGPLRRAAARAKDDADATPKGVPKPKHFLIIDEINRGNIAKIFGELYFLLEYRDEPSNLQYSNRPFSLPPNLYIIGTMNTADRSIALVDLALRRRFYFVEFHPDDEPVKSVLRRWLEAKAPEMLWVANVVEKVNERMKDDRHAAIGPSYFMRDNLDGDAVKRIWMHSVLPYIEERRFWRRRSLRRILFGETAWDGKCGSIGRCRPGVTGRRRRWADQRRLSIMRQLNLKEYHPSDPKLLTSAELRQLKAAELRLSITPTGLADSEYTLTPSSTVGAMELGGLSVLIQPKIGIPRLLSLACYAMGAYRLKDERPFHFEERTSLPDALALALGAAAQHAFSRGLLHGYIAVEEAIQTVRGRIRFDEQTRRRFAIPIPVEVRYDEFTDDILANQLIKAAARRLSLMKLRSGQARRNLGWIAGTLENVSFVEFPPNNVPRVRKDRLNDHYSDVIALSCLILRHGSFESGRGGIRASGFLMDMNEVFQEFVTAALRESLGLSGGAFRENSISTLDVHGRVSLSPDLVWREGSRCLFVGDAKYKRIDYRDAPNADLYQLLAYTTALDLPGGMLIYAKGEGKPAVHSVRHSGKRLEVVALDLEQDLDAVLADVREVAEQIRILRGRTSCAITLK